MSVCKHQSHRTELVPYRIQGVKGKKDVPMDSGWNPVRRAWEFCDRGLWEPVANKLNSTKRTHSQPKKKNNRTNSTEEMV